MRPLRALLLAAALAPLHAQPAEPPLALVNATLVDGGVARPGTTIVVARGRIAAVGPVATTRVPRGATVVPLDGAVVMPGLVDMHYHVVTGAMRYRRTAAGALDSTFDRALAERLLRVALAHGITTIRDPGASPASEAVALRDDVARGRVLGPRILTAGAILNDPRLTEPALREAVRAQAAAGVDFVKVYAGLAPPQVAAVVDEAHRRGVRVVGHLQRTSWTDAARAGIDAIAHGAPWHESYLPPDRRAPFLAVRDMRQRVAWYEGLDPASPAVDTLVAELARRGVAVDPTLVAYHTKFFWRDSIYQRDPDAAIVPEVRENWRVLGMHTEGWTAEDFARVKAAWPKQLALVRRLHAGGVLLTAGSDLASPWVIPGVALHQELALLESAGLSRAAVLRAATRDAARALRLDGEIGSVDVGKRADLLVLDADPLHDLAATRRIRTVILGGRRHTPAALLRAR
jgi:imidazolonepropionase-like amidohydrolase